MPNQPDFILSSFYPAHRSKAVYRNDYYLGRLCSQLGYEREDEISGTLEKVFKLCKALEIPITENFERVFFERGATLYSDWKITKLGMYLFILNSEREGKMNSRNFTSNFYDNMYSFT
jgi:hypothetical protein